MANGPVGLRGRRVQPGPAIPQFVDPGQVVFGNPPVNIQWPKLQLAQPDWPMEPPIRPRPVPAPPPGEGEDWGEPIPGWDVEEEEEPDDEAPPQRLRFEEAFDLDAEIEKAKRGFVNKEKKVRVRADYNSRVSSTKSTRLPLFKMAYEGADEMTLRLQGTLINTHDTMLYVRHIQNVQCEFSGAVGLGAQCDFPDGSRRGIIFNKERTNLRSPDPGYIQIDDLALYYHRIPARIYKQGINSENTMFKAVHSGMRYAVFGHYPIEDILTSFDERPIIQWVDVWPENFLSYRLSDRVALSRSNGAKSIVANYKGRKVGTVVDRKLKLSKDVESDFWMSRAFAAVGIES